ncbi:hypothetical protein HMPREF1248_1571 [Coriobacteriaceae bacterium BV3Ac1]|nr:hypothetical protein [Olegusella massiliensis]ERL12721.1 hypothetical protein HMPREF1248_1571 [Coriobacteriaceae bacterium BV3Ac1]
MSSKKKVPVVAATATETKGEEHESTSSPMIDERHAKFMRDAEQWVVENPTAWTFFLDKGRTYAAEGRAFGVQEFAEYVRRHDFTDVNGKTTRLNNSLVPALARLLITEVPECRPLIARRTNVYDGSIQHAAVS